jgi:glycosyltransferase involved in cell wall biosynthesis
VSGAPRLLFVPASGARGAGEYFRCIAIARAAQARWPAAGIHFIVNAEAGYARPAPFPTTVVQGSPTYNTAAVNAAIADFAPHVVVFDSAGRVGQLREARRRGAATVYVSSRFKTRWKGFRLRRMRLLDQHWLAWPRFIGGELTAWERFKLALLRRPEVLFLDPVHEPSDPARRARLRERIGVGDRPYVLFSSGGGGYQRTGMPAPEIFARAALEVRRAGGFEAVWVKGPNYEGGAFDAGNLLALGSVPSESMIDLLAGAHLAVISGGSLLLQALALGTPVVAAPVAADQPQRIAGAERCAAVVGAALDPQALARAAQSLLAQPARLEQMRAQLRSLGIGNGAQQGVEALARLLPAGATGAAR